MSGTTDSKIVNKTICLIATTTELRVQGLAVIEEPYVYDPDVRTARVSRTLKTEDIYRNT